MCKPFFTILLLFLIATTSSCQNNDNDVKVSSIKYFGFTIVDTFWDDPSDKETKTNYLDEVHTFTNIYDVFAVHPTHDLTEAFSEAQSMEMNVMIHLHEIFFELEDGNAPSGANYKLKSDFKTRWDSFITTNDLPNQSSVVALYLGEEPFWNGIGFEELEAASDYIKSSGINASVVLVEAYLAIQNLEIPSAIDWVGFDHYFIQSPDSDQTYQSELSLLKQKMKDHQKLIIVMDSHFIKEVHQDLANINIEDMKAVANAYYTMAKREKAIALLGYFWPNGFDAQNAVGARGMPSKVLDNYKRIGKEITGK